MDHSRKKNETFDLSPENGVRFHICAAGDPCKAYADFPSHIGALTEQ
jgi:hypothetical protein